MDVKSPLEAAGFEKRDVRSLSKKVGLPGWDKPSNTCLATRIPYGSRLTEEKLTEVGNSEAALRDMGFRGFRVRHHEDIARLELKPDDLTVALKKRREITEKLKKIGFSYVALDLEGYRPGSLTEVQEGRD